MTPALSRSSSAESDYELEDEENEVSLRCDAALWTIDQDEALLNVLFSFLCFAHELDLLGALGWASITVGSI